ncbi:MAG: hypothetical protein OEY36_03310 [Gammaproteobacteria bacterium]|nr:hypothetical protein [Gammaproteobacteria bacterium]
MTFYRICIIGFLFFSGPALLYAAADKNQESLRLGLELIQHKKFQQAEQYFIELTRQQPKQIAYLNNLAVAQMAQGKTDQALENLKSALVADKYVSITQKNISNIYAYMASQAYAKALDVEQAENKLPALASITDIKPLPADDAALQTEKTEKAVPAKSIEAELKLLFENKINSWMKAWSDGDSSAYIAYYSTEFIPSGKLSYKDWLALRRYRLRHSKQVDVSYNQLNMFFNADKTLAIVEFVQHYKAGKYQDKVRKQLYWQRQNDDWLISREQVTEKLK